MSIRLKYLFTPFILFFAAQILGQTVTLSGYIKDAANGETLIGANIFNGENQAEGTSTNAYGFYSLSLEPGTYTIAITYLGYNNFTQVIDLRENLTRDFELSQGAVLKEVTISAAEAEKDANVQSTQMGKVELPMENIKKLPALLGEVDILKTLQLLPGVASAGEGGSGFYVRGGGPDQNLVLLDEAVVYNTGHLLGFFSVFNADAIKNTTLIKGGMPARYGGRLSSVVDVQMSDGNYRNYQAEGGVGIISSRLTVQGPIQKDKSSFLVSGRRTYALDLAQPFLEGGTFEGTNYYFYDFNAKLNFKLSDKDRIFASGYFGRDVLNFRQPERDFNFDLPYGNTTATLRWNHLFSDKLFMNVSAIYNDYKFAFTGGQEDFVFQVRSSVEDVNLKVDFDYYPNPEHSIKYGVNTTYHKLTPNTASAQNGDVSFESGFQPKYAQETGFYIEDDYKLSPQLSLNGGIRFSIFSQLGPFTSKIDGQEFGRFEAGKTYTGFEPRLSGKYTVSKDMSLKAAVTFTNQYLHLVTNSGSTLPTDIWVPSTELIEPQQGVQYAFGIFKNFQDAMWETSVEFYYKDLQNQIDYADDYVNDFGREIEESFVFGEGRAYGAEFFLRKNRGKLTGWVGYTIARTERSFPDIEGGRWYPAVYDRLHDLSVVANYEINDKLELGASFVYGSGRWFTPFQSFYFIEGNVAPEYGPRNSAQLPDYHRFDLSLTYTPKAKVDRSFKGSWNLSFYNIYNRKNPYFIFYDATINREVGTTQLEAFQVTIFPIIPSISYSFKWNQNAK